MSGSGEKSSGWGGGWIFLVFLVVLAFHVVAILGIAVFNGWKYNATNTSQTQNPVPLQQKTMEFVEKSIPEAAVAPVPNAEPLVNDEKISSHKQSALEKQILSGPDDEPLAIPAPIVSEPSPAAPKKEEAGKIAASSAAAAAVVHEKSSKKASPPPELVKSMDHADVGLVESKPSLAMPAASKEKASPLSKNSAAPVLVAAGTSKKAQASGNGYGTYTVQKGDTFNKIARDYNTTLNNLYKINSIKDPNGLKAGMTIKVPGK